MARTMRTNPDGRIAGRTLEDGRVTWSHKYDMNVVFEPPDGNGKCSACGSGLVLPDGKWHGAEVKNGKYYCEKCSASP